VDLYPLFSARGPSPARSRATQPGRWGCIWLLVIAVVLVGCLGANLLIHTQYRDVPNLFGPHQITYTPAKGPASASLLATRPERIYQRYLDDYLHLAGTYPCLADLPLSFDNITDPVLQGKPCHVTRPVASLAITAVTIVERGLGQPQRALLQIQVTYTDGTKWAREAAMDPGEDHLAWGSYYTQLDCWSSFDTLQMFGRLVPDIPIGAQYLVSLPNHYACKH
jgi:hypothetical protein